MKQPDTATPTEPVGGTVVASAEVCPYCHKLLDEENGGCRLTHEHGKTNLPRVHHPLYSELEDLLREGVNLPQYMPSPRLLDWSRRVRVALGERGGK